MAWHLRNIGDPGLSSSVRTSVPPPDPRGRVQALSQARLLHSRILETGGESQSPLFPEAAHNPFAYIILARNYSHNDTRAREVGNLFLDVSRWPRVLGEMMSFKDVCITFREKQLLVQTGCFCHEIPKMFVFSARPRLQMRYLVSSKF